MTAKCQDEKKMYLKPMHSTIYSYKKVMKKTEAGDSSPGLGTKCEM